jgi:hypothetical protein
MAETKARVLAAAWNAGMRFALPRGDVADWTDATE